jgi:hypothetical protein
MGFRTLKAVLFVSAALVGSATIGAAGSPGIDYVGNWSNVNPNSGGLAKVTVENRGQGFLVHIWGKCHPDPCDWGVARAKVFAGTVSSSPASDVASLEALYNPGFARKRVVLRLRNASTMEVETSTHFTDNSGRQDMSMSDMLRRIE